MWGIGSAIFQLLTRKPADLLQCYVTVRFFTFTSSYLPIPMHLDLHHRDNHPSQFPHIYPHPRDFRMHECKQPLYSKSLLRGHHPPCAVQFALCRHCSVVCILLTSRLISCTRPSRRLHAVNILRLRSAEMLPELHNWYRDHHAKLPSRKAWTQP